MIDIFIRREDQAEHYYFDSFTPQNADEFIAMSVRHPFMVEGVLCRFIGRQFVVDGDDAYLEIVVREIEIERDILN